MPEPTPESTPEPEPPPERAPSQRINWSRVRIYLWCILLSLAMWIGGTLITIRLHPDRYVRWALAQLPFSASSGKVFWQNRRTLEIDDVKLGGFFYANSIVITASPFGLIRRHVAKVQVFSPQLFTESLYAAMDKIPAGDGVGEGIDWTIGRFEISRGTLMINNLIANTAVPIRLGVRYPIVLNNLKLGKPDQSPEMTKERRLEIGSVAIVSPVDPLVPVLTFPLTRVRFTYAELWHHHIREVDLVRPTMYLGEDLFWFTSQMEKESQTPPSSGPTSPWQVAHFEVQYGRLAVSALGQPVALLPFFVETEVNDVRLDQLDKISAKSAVVIKRLDQDYPDYKIRLVNLSGRLYFSWPPTDDKANNVVNTIKIDEIAWNDIPVKEVWSNVTFDPSGVYGKLGGKCENGLMTGNFEFYYTKGFTWNANFFADHINVQPIAQKLGGKYLNLTGQLDGDLSVQGMITDILKCHGALTLPKPGVLEIKSLDSMLNQLPGQLSVKDQAVNLAIESFRTYPYDSGELKIDYHPSGGLATLLLQSPEGKRDFNIYWHPAESSKVANATDNR